MEFESWKVNFETEVCSKTADLHLTMHWIKEVVMARPIDELNDIAFDCAAKRFSRLRYAWCDDCVCIEKTSRQIVHFRKRVSDEEQRDQKYGRFLRGGQIAYMIYEHFRATGAYETVQRLADLVSMTLQNDDVQDFDVRWDHAL